MKNFVIYVSGVMLFLTGSMLTSCSEEGFTSFDGSKNGIYFQRTYTTDINGNPLQYTDSTVVTFSSYPDEQQTMTVQVPVCIMGDVKDYDRVFVVKVDDEKTTAERGVHYDFDESKCVIAASTTRVSIPVTLYRHPDLQENTLRIELSLVDNNEFTVELESYKNRPSWNATGEELCGSRFKIIFSDIYQITDWWEWYGTEYFGTWSATKEKRLNALMGWTHADWDDWNIPYGTMAYAAKLFKKELQALADAGTPVIDEDGSFMQLEPPYTVDYSAYEKR